ncbi:tyrosine-type recombinase/integrase [Nocardiopsis salina]|uniref:tyrosine-type recombinase/integrase n=1 Tax=Nocardiopsis salina TaxID=245836 RepID=UPI00047544B4|nr:site-specific integrase [Nocardiopsis salina]
MASQQGRVFKRCGCRDQDSGRVLGAKCPKLRRRSGAWSSTHGQWGYQVELPRTAQDGRRQARQVGLDSQETALEALQQVRTLLDLAGRDHEDLVQVADLIQAEIRARRPLPEADEVKRRLQLGVDLRSEVPTVEQWLSEWLENKPDLTRNTRRSYSAHITNHLIPHLGKIRLDKLQARHIEAMFTAIEDGNERIIECRESGDTRAWEKLERRRMISLPTKHRIRATLRSALSDAVRRPDLPVSFNAASHARLPSCPRRKPLVWTADRVAHWEKDGTVPGEVMIWTPEQTIRFLEHARKYAWLFALFHLIAVKGLRRGEAVGLPWANTRMVDGQVDIRTQVVQLGWETHTCVPKSTAGERTITLDADTVRVLRSWRRRQMETKLARGAEWVETGLVFTADDGRGWHPAQVTDWFQRIARAAGLPPISLHGLRHGAASMSLAAGVDVKVVSAELGHATTHFTQDTYQTVFPDVAKAAAEATAAMLKPAVHRA